jgi:hypothetical protein
MAELSEVRDRVRQIINDALAHANKVGRMVYAGDNVVDPVIKAAQLPWDEPSDEEWSAIFHSIPSSSARSWACEFVRRRNAALQPKPVDPRLEKIRSALVYHAAHRFNQLITPNQFDEAALAVLTALNEVK